MKFEVHSARKTGFSHSACQLPSVEPSEDELKNASQPLMAQVDTVQLSLPNRKMMDRQDLNVQSVCEWTESQVLDWLTSMNLFKVKDNFQLNHITGSNLPGMTDTKLKEIGIEDIFQRRMVITCLDELCERKASEEDSEGSSTESSDECTSDRSEHDLQEQLFSASIKCHKCGKGIIRGSSRQGFQCAACGLCLHTECIKGKIQPCNSEKLESRKRQTQCSAPSFGSDLCKDVPRSKNKTVPDIICLCCQEVERQMQTSPDVNVVQAYKLSKSNDKVDALKKTVENSGDPFAVPLHDWDLLTICGVLKKYLRELANPLVPTDMYEDFLSAAKETDEQQGVIAIGALVNELPKYHSSTLQFLFNHFSKVAESRVSKGDDGKLDFAKIFCHLILRPDWSEIMNMVDNTSDHMTVIRRLFIFYDNNNNTDMDESDTSCSLPQSLASDGLYEAPSTPSSKTLFANQYEERILPLDQYPWYWADVSREDVQEATTDVEEGSFLVRKATSYPTHGDYTLVLRKGGGNLLIKIYHRHGQFGFCADSCPFESVPSLVSYYQHHSLAEYNASLNLTLRRGIAKPSQYDPYRSSDPQSLLSQLTRNHTELLSLTRECDSLLEKQARMSHDMQKLHQAQESFKELSEIFEEQVEWYTQQKVATDGSAQDSNEVQKNAEELRARLHSINKSKGQLGLNIRQKTGDNLSLTADINSIKPALRSLRRKQDHIVNALLSQGITRHELEYAIRGDHHTASHTSHTSSRLEPLSESALFANKDIPHIHKSTWYVKCTRAEAIENLQHRKDGTFLIRPGSQDNPYSLSIAINGMVGHCKVLEQDGRYGFAAPYILHDTLVDLVLHYKDHSLAHHNSQLNTKLLYPINSHSNDYQ
ncbi:phosphatidylinositol 3-kinase regulatory subunit alpha-like [Watersipora subatra]|uniref:phosphatidylinositol 3-kinase regulatory subunit alpha-like n=1 Tax=Watersipora subatra TaxID=2589382 RepID=UPI00355B90B9